MGVALRGTKGLGVLGVSAALLFAGASAPLAEAAPKQQTVDDATCAQWEGWYKDHSRGAVEAFINGNPQQGHDLLGQAAYVKNMAAKAGCGWATAARAVPGALKPRVQIESLNLR